MDVLSHLSLGFSVVLVPEVLLSCFIGVLLGTLVGVLPGLGCAAAVALLLPFTFKLSPLASMVMLAGIFYGASYGGSTTSILVNIPGEASSVVTCLDGHQMARQGRAGPALGISALGSFIGGTFAVLMTMLVGPTLAAFALQFGYPEFFSLTLAAITMVAFLAQGSKLKAFIAATLGIMISLVGQDPIIGVERFTFGITTISDGFGFVPVIIGLFGVPEILENVEDGLKQTVLKTKIKNLLPTRKDWKESGGPITRATFLGFFLGLMPGVGGMLPTFVSYALEKRLSKNPDEFGKGAIAGVAGPETANNAGAGGSFIPLLTLGIPTNAVMAMLMTALLMQGIRIGPLLVTDHPEIFWGLIASMYVGNIMLVALNLPLIGLWVRILSVPYTILFPVILLLVGIASYSIHYNTYDILLTLIMGFLGYLMRKFRYEPAPLIFGFLLGFMLEKRLRQSLLYSSGDLSIFINRPISAVFVLLAAFLIISAVISEVSRKRREGENISLPGASSTFPESYDSWSGIVILVFALAFGWGGMKLGIGSIQNPGAGFFSVVLAASLSFLSLVLIGKTLRRKNEKQSTVVHWHGPHPYRAAFVIIALLAYVFILEPLGFIVSSLLLMIFLFKGVETLKWRVSFIAAILVVFSSYSLFSLLLHVHLPRGPFGF